MVKYERNKFRMKKNELKIQIFRILKKSHSGVTARFIGEVLERDPSNMNQALIRYEKWGLVKSRKINKPGWGKITYWYITAHGKRRLDYLS